MGHTLKEIAQKLQSSNNTVQLIYAFNGVGKTRLSREFKELIAPKTEDEDEEPIKVLYYNAFTEDLFYWDNDLETDENRKLLIRSNSFTNWILKDQGQENNIITYFQEYINNEKLAPHFNEKYSEVTFSIERGNDETIDDVKISRGEESCFIWCVFYSILKQAIDVLTEHADPKDRETNLFDDLKYIFIDDPVSSLDENHLIEIAVNLAILIRKAKGQLHFIISTHNALFYNVLYNELELKKKNKKNNACCYMLDKNEDGSFELKEKYGDSNKSFSYHLYLKQIIEEAIKTNNIQKYHFTLLRNLYEKTANFLGYSKWSDLLPEDKQVYYNRIIQFTSHSTLSNEAIAEPSRPEKNTLKMLFEHLVKTKYWEETKKEEIKKEEADDNI